MSDVVSCIRVPGREKYYVCFTSDYRVFQSPRFLRGSQQPPPPPSRVCRFPDLFRDLGSPSAFANAVGVPCRLTPA